MGVQGPGRPVSHSSAVLGSRLHCCGCLQDSITQSVVHYCLSQLRPWKLSSCKWKGTGGRQSRLAYGSGARRLL